MNAGRHNHADDIAYPSSIGFVLVHLGCLAAFWTGVTPGAVLLGRRAVFGADLRASVRVITATSRIAPTAPAAIFQFILAFLAQTSAQRGVLWWAANHRMHHRYSDTELDVHSPIQRGFLYSHVGWIFVPRNNDTDYAGFAT